MESPVLQCFLPLGQHIWWQLRKHCRGAAPHHDHNVNELHCTRHTRGMQGAALRSTSWSSVSPPTTPSALSTTLVNASFSSSAGVMARR